MQKTSQESQQSHTHLHPWSFAFYIFFSGYSWLSAELPPCYTQDSTKKFLGWFLVKKKVSNKLPTTSNKVKCCFNTGDQISRLSKETDPQF